MPPTLTAYVPLPPAVCSPPAGPGSPAASAPALCRTSYAAADGKGMPSATEESPARNPVELMTVPLSEEVEGPALQETDPGVYVPLPVLSTLMRHTLQWLALSAGSLFYYFLTG